VLYCLLLKLSANAPAEAIHPSSPETSAMYLSQVPTLPTSTGVSISLLVTVQLPSWVLLPVSPTTIFPRKYNSSEFQELLTPALPLLCCQTALILRMSWPLVPHTIR